MILFLIMMSSFSTHAEENEEEGMEEFVELTGNLNYMLFGLAVLILPWKYIYKGIVKNIDREHGLKGGLKGLHGLMKNLHYIIGILAALVITYHAYLVISKWNVVLVLGLSLIWFYVITGVLFLIDNMPGKVKKWAYKVHGSKIYLVITAIILYLGHVMLD